MSPAQDLVQSLLSWYHHQARPLPWRQTRDPYAIWISEVMLQQTQVETVIPYWERWLKVFPDVQTLARARLDRVLKLWEGLGYYTRARNLQAAARRIVQEHGGVFPREYHALLDLPGIGRYTAGALCSIAFDQPTPILDGNVIRVLTRLFGIRDPVRRSETNQRLWDLAGKLVGVASTGTSRKPGACSAFNQALMELGATVCRPKQPKCSECPLASRCVARRTDRIDSIPDLGRRAAITHRHFVAFVARSAGRVWVRQRPAKVLNAHLWEFPNVEWNSAPPGKKSEVTMLEAVAKLARQCLGRALSQVQPLCTVRHSITRYRVRLDAYLVRLRRPETTRLKGGRWLLLKQLEKRAFPSAHKQVLARVRAVSDDNRNRARTIRNRSPRGRDRVRRSC